MAKINITVELDWLEEGPDGFSLDETLKEEITNGIVSRFSNDISKKIIADANKRIESATDQIIDKQINEMMGQFLNKKIDLQDKWGDVTEENVSILDLLKRRLDNYLLEKVDENGQKNSYGNGKARIDWKMESIIDRPMERKIQKAADDIKKQLEELMQKQLQEKVGKNIVELLKIDKL